MTETLTFGQEESVVEELKRIETEIKESDQRAEKRHEETTKLIHELSTQMAVMRERGDSSQRMALDHESRIRTLEKVRWVLHGMTGILALLGSWILQKLFPSQ